MDIVLFIMALISPIFLMILLYQIVTIYEKTRYVSKLGIMFLAICFGYYIVSVTFLFIGI